MEKLVSCLTGALYQPNLLSPSSITAGIKNKTPHYNKLQVKPGLEQLETSYNLKLTQHCLKK